MATRVNRKNAGAPSPKEVVPTDKHKKNETFSDSSLRSEVNKSKVTSIGRKLAKKNPKAIKKSSLALKLKAKAKTTRINPLAKNVKALAETRKLLRNGVKEIKLRRRKVQVKKEDVNDEDTPPVLEPIFPIDENVDNKKQSKKRLGAKKTQKSEIPELKKIKAEVKIDNEEELSLSSDVTDVSNQEPPKPPRKRVLRKTKPEAETLEDVMNDLTFLIKQEVKTEPDSMSESGKSETISSKPKKLTKKQRIELLKKSIVKKENLENTLSKLDAADQKVIDMLDLNVKNIKKVVDVKRRHSIEKFPIGADGAEIPLSLFGPLPRSSSPRSKGGAGRRKACSPYSTRSDSPARKLRSGKQRNTGLLDGLEFERKRKRLCSDLSTSEASMNKLSGYESDNSNFSDMTSTQSTEHSDTKDHVLEEIKQTASNGPIGIVDTNSNVCDNLNEIKEPLEDKLTYNSDTSDKVPDKLMILDIMKKAFNDVVKTEHNEQMEPMKTSKFYGKTDEMENAIKVPEKIDKEAFSDSDKETQLEAVNEVLLEEEEEKEVNEDAYQQTSFEDEKDPLALTESETILEPQVEEVHSESKSPTEPVTSIQMTELIEPIEPVAVMEKEPCDDSILPEEPPVADEAPVLKDAVEQMETVETESNVEEKTQTNCDEEITPEKTGDLTEKVGEAVREDETELENGAKVDEEEEDVTVEETDIDRDKDRTEASATITEHNEAVESEEDVPDEFNVLKALGLHSLRAAEEFKQQKQHRQPSLASKGDAYTGTLKTVIKINRDKRKGGRKTIGLKGKSTKSSEEDYQVAGISEDGVKESNKNGKEGQSTSWRHAAHSSDTAGARKSHYSNRSNMDGSSEHTSDGEATAPQDGTVKALVIPEKASSFSIHPGRLCKDECSYCFGKFGLFDTPCHIAQMKSVERQDKILATEKHLTRDSCLCDACYRHVDRKSNTPSYSNRSLKRGALVAPGPRQNHCHVLGCDKEATNILRRKWIIKMRKSICQEINIDLDNPGLHSIPICAEHHGRLEHLMVCAMCKRRLARNHAHRISASEARPLGEALEKVELPMRLLGDTERPVVCKLCKCFAAIAMKKNAGDDNEEIDDGEEEFFKEYKRRLLHFNDIVPMDEAAAEEPLAMPVKTDKKKKLVKGSLTEDGTFDESGDVPDKRERVPSSDMSQSQSRSESPSDDYNGVDYNTLIPAIAMDCSSDTEMMKKDLSSKKYPTASTRRPVEMLNHAVEITKIPKMVDPRVSDLAVQKLGSNPSISVRQLFPGEEELPLNAHIEFGNVKDRTPEGWEKCTSTIQYDAETKRLWQELQKPYGNQSSFLRHLILLEKYFRNGDLVLSPRAGHHSINYSESVHNRLKAYDNIPSSAGNIQPISMIQFNKMSRSSSGIITSSSVNATVLPPATIHPTKAASSSLTVSPIPPMTALPSATTIIKTITNNSSGGNGPVTITQVPSSSVPTGINRPPKGPPGLISIQQKTATPALSVLPGATISNKQPSLPGILPHQQSQKIKFPITKNWRPNLIPIEPGEPMHKKKGLVQVISGGKPYHITLEDYKKMCAIKRSFELKQRRMQEAAASKSRAVQPTTTAQQVASRRGLVISKTTTTVSSGGLSTLGQNHFIGGNVSDSGSSKNGGELVVGAGADKGSSEVNGEPENILEKLDKQVEKIGGSNLLPKIPKSLTVIPQTVPRKPSRPASPVLQITATKKS